jgi:hypothetical protein
VRPQSSVVADCRANAHENTEAHALTHFSRRRQAIIDPAGPGGRDQPSRMPHQPAERAVRIQRPWHEQLINSA